MNQEGYFEEALKLPNALSALGRRVPATGRPLVMLGLREHIYTSGLSAPAYFMAQQEHLFGTMFQRLMSSPLYVRMHYGCVCSAWAARCGARGVAAAVQSKGSHNVTGAAPPLLPCSHPDLFDRVWMASRGGTAKAVSLAPVGGL